MKRKQLTAAGNALCAAEEMAWDAAKERGATDDEAEALAEMAYDAEKERQAAQRKAGGG